MNYMNPDTNKKLVSEIYKSSQYDLKRRLQNSSSKQRVNTKESINRSQSKNRKTSVSRQSNKDLKKGVSGSASARKIVYANNEWVLTNATGQNRENSKMPSRTSSVSNLKKRSLSSNAVQGVTAATSVTSLVRRSNSNQKVG